MVLATFFLWRLLSKCRDCWGIIPVILPVLITIIVVMLFGISELALGVIWGMVAINLGAVGALSICFKDVIVAPINVIKALFWLSLGWLTCVVAGFNGVVGKFSGWGLMVVGGLVAWQIWYRQFCSKQLNLQKQSLVKNVQWWGCLFLTLLLGIGVYLMVKHCLIVGVLLKIPVNVAGVVIIAPICEIAIWSGLRQQNQWQPAKILSGIMWSNGLLVTIGLGLVTIWFGGLHLPQSICLVTLPWIAGLAILTVIRWYLPQKTARWWSGLIVVMYMAYLINLLV